MGVPFEQIWSVSKYVIGQKLRRVKHYPLVLMLEPLYRCNLACAGCGKIQYPAHVLKKNLSVAECLAATDECSAPIVSIPGGEPLMHPEIDKIVEGLIARKKFIYLCTNALLLKQKLALFKPSKYLTFSVHMDGAKEDHDFSVCKEGGYEIAKEAIQEAVTHGFRVTTNCTLFDHADPNRTRQFFDDMMDLGVESMMISPGYSYSKAPNQSDFLKRDHTYELFRRLFTKRKKTWKFSHSPLFLEFLMGKRYFECTPWGNVTYNTFGWQKPCYLLQEGYEGSLSGLMENTRWENYGRASGNPQCANCMVHCGFEASAVDFTFSGVKGIWANMVAAIRGVSSEHGKNITPPPVTRFVETGIYAKQNGNELAAKLRDAVDFRGDVTIHMKDGTQHEGYLFNLTDSAAEFYPKNDSKKACVFIRDIRDVEKSGRDTASGKSWENWVAKYNARKEALARGEKFEENIEPQPEAL